MARNYYLYVGSTDMRKSFNGLAGLVINEMNKPLDTGDGFIFINKRRTMVKILVWDRNGFVIYYKKLSSGSIELPKSDQDVLEIKVEISTLLMMLEGVEINSVRLRKRYKKSA